MKKELESLVKMSLKLGQDKSQILAAGGNTSFKNEDSIWVKGSGTELGLVSRNDFVECDRKMLEANLEITYSSKPNESFTEARKDLLATMINPDSRVKPSVETSIHVLLQSPFVAHTHPTLINALTSSVNGKKMIGDMFPGRAIFIEYNYPGFALFSAVKGQIDAFRASFGKDPDYIFLKNHGLVIGGRDTNEIENKYKSLVDEISSITKNLPAIEQNEISAEKLTAILPAVRMMLSKSSIKVLKFHSHSLIDHFMETDQSFAKISRPFCFDHVKHGGGKYIYTNKSIDNPDFLEELSKDVTSFRLKNGYLPRVILIKTLGLIVAADSARDAQGLMDIFEDQMKISYLSENYGGPAFLSDEDIELIQTRLADGAVAKAPISDKEELLGNKIAIITGGAQGFGEGIVRDLFSKKANIVIADLNEETSSKLLADLNGADKSNHAIFVKTDVSDPNAVQNLISQTVKEFGGLDLMISNAGVLFAGGLDEMKPEIFDLVTKVNYKGYFLCAKYSSAVMKLQSEYSETHFSDIIQINSKSGLKGSNKNFAYAGGKFGGIGLTQSFAMELMPFRVKVNSIAPGNLLDGPLWSDPENGLFVQYLRAGKVPGAKILADVKRFYEAQVPANRGCTVDDVMKAVYYIIDQKYETGQAVPVTGGQIMLN